MFSRQYNNYKSAAIHQDCYHISIWREHGIIIGVLWHLDEKEWGIIVRIIVKENRKKKWKIQLESNTKSWSEELGRYPEGQNCRSLLYATLLVSSPGARGSQWIKGDFRGIPKGRRDVSGSQGAWLAWWKIWPQSDFFNYILPIAFQAKNAWSALPIFSRISRLAVHFDPGFLSPNVLENL